MGSTRSLAAGAPLAEASANSLPLWHQGASRVAPSAACCSLDFARHANVEHTQFSARWQFAKQGNQ